MVLKANPKYWGTAHKAVTQNVILRFLTDDNAAVNALKSGDVDVLSPVNATLAKSLDAKTYKVSPSIAPTPSFPTSAYGRPSATPSTMRKSSPPEEMSTMRSAVRSHPSTPAMRT